MSLLWADLYAFYLEHRRCGELEADVPDEVRGWVFMVCPCGAELVRRIDEFGAGDR